MAALEGGDTDTSPNASKKPRVHVAPTFSDSIEEREDSHGHDEDHDGVEEVEEDEQSQGEPDDNGGDEPESPDGDDEEEEEESGGDVHGGEAEAETGGSEQASLTRAVVAVAGVTVEDADTLECGVCCLPLRPPIFQCEVGHVVCAPCRDKLAPAGKCYVCRVAVAGGEYRRCYALERLVDSIRVACPHAARGCDATPAYHGLDAHRRACPHAVCHCPGEACGFAGSTAALLDHFAAAHSWPCITDVRTGETYRLHDGFNFHRVEHHPGDGDHRLIMLNMTREPLGRAISVLCIHPHAAPAAEMQCELRLYVSRPGDGGSGGGGGLCISHYQRSVFHIGYSDLADGVPDRRQRFQFVVPRHVVGDDDEGGIRIRVRIKY
uniref:RING-type E3 ubiquitin transferase n=1 Tax=Oryza punctata TaxID=4537 RepID=A0A0E0KYL6_ORYPU